MCVSRSKESFHRKLNSGSSARTSQIFSLLDLDSCSILRKYLYQSYDRPLPKHFEKVKTLFYKTVSQDGEKHRGKIREM